MPSNEISNVIRAYLEAVNMENPGQVKTLFAEDVKWSSPAGKRTGHEETRKYMERWFSAFPDLKLEQTNAFGEGNQLVIECRMTGTHQGQFVSDFGQFAPTNKRIDVDLVNLLKIQDGKISEIRVFYDSGVIMSQLGIQIEKQRAA